MSEQANDTRLNLLSSFIWTFWGLFGLSFALFFPINTQILPDIQRTLRPLIQPALEFTSPLLFTSPPIDYSISSDSKSMYLLAALLLTFSLVITCLIHLFKFRISANIVYWIKVLFRYYVAYQLLHYGCNKLFKWQFFLPEPNVAYSRIGEVSKDLLYWTAIGSSYWFTVIIGSIEIVAGLLLLFRKTLALGLVIAFVLFTNIVLVNFSFNISVKLFSLFLLFLTISLFRIDWRLILSWLRETLHVHVDTKSKISFKGKMFAPYAVTKSIVILALIFDSLWMYGTSGNWNDDKQPRPPLHGAYTTILNTANEWQSVYVNRKGYVIAKDSQDIMLDYKLHYDTAATRIMLTRLGDTLSFGYSESKKFLTLNEFGSNHLIVLEKQPYDSLPLFEKSFDWWVD